MLPSLSISFTYDGYRYYSPQLGRWITRDPIGERGEFNLYAFVGNRATDTSDAWGLHYEINEDDDLIGKLPMCFESEGFRSEE
jgi:hypothetical protein